MNLTIEKCLREIWFAGVDAVRGEGSVKTALTDFDLPKPDQIISIGKAAADMLSGAQLVFGSDIPAMVVTKYGHSQSLPGSVRTIEAAHPIPDSNSLIAGREVLRVVKQCPQGSHLLMLVSGGASSLVELLSKGNTLADLQTENSRLLASGLDIGPINMCRKEISQIKGGKLLSHFAGASVNVLAISDVEGDDLSVLGSGIGQGPKNPQFSFSPYIVASNKVARDAAAARAASLGLNVVVNAESLYADVYELAVKIADELRNGPTGVYIWGGEPTTILPSNPGHGGRNQALALALAEQILRMDELTVLVAGTDGTDGPTDAAGGLVTSKTWTDKAALYLKHADSGTFLQSRGALFKSGPTGTNVMDLLIAAKH
ncbi:glycerate kinase type-2 family protein [Cohaesibacter gelatinilyticus]|uniref:Hydroxypyruvate reductase n=1 Tax=Cohaesibacter gelatinilyticus TaxID=372072 RepID=A0A285PC69_9HYPH|nr:DUF4147 domain-containing protein [Cohaesibacter gelatinilyticus]SNZ19319.1 hydroxypyruvate reductase [Cohaesibacter gelatinilyticus]